MHENSKSLKKMNGKSVLSVLKNPRRYSSLVGALAVFTCIANFICSRWTAGSDSGQEDRGDRLAPDGGVIPQFGGCCGRPHLCSQLCIWAASLRHKPGGQRHQGLTVPWNLHWWCNLHGLTSSFWKITRYLGTFEPPHDKTNKLICAPSKDSDQPGHPPSLVRGFVVHSMGS